MSSDAAEKMRFEGKAVSAAMKLGGSLEDKEAAPFLDRLYNEWKELAIPLASTEAWLSKRLGGTFKCIGSTPVWIEDEPAWPFIDGKPMVFLSQCSHPKEGSLSSELSAGETVYLFAGRRTTNGKTRMEYRTVSQFEKGY
ncbi:MAG: hypothetical protein JNM43_22645 [Planctomycetaceae bacterium]|nr:hypothetical protein [Planctomycetaceae bacterium]